MILLRKNKTLKININQFERNLRKKKRENCRKKRKEYKSIEKIY